VKNLELEAAVTPASGRLSFIDRCGIEDLGKAGYNPARMGVSDGLCKRVRRQGARFAPGKLRTP
jgi:hypothetical protein